MIISRIFRKVNKFIFKVEMIFLRKKFLYLGRNTKFENGYFAGVESLAIRDHVYIGPGFYINANGGVEIGEGTIIGPNVVILSRNHKWTRPTFAPYDEGNIDKKVSIGKGCWLGYGVKIAPGVTIGDGVIIGIGLTITEDIPSYTIVKSVSNLIIERRDSSEIKSAIDNHVYYMARGL